MDETIEYENVKRHVWNLSEYEVADAIRAYILAMAKYKTLTKEMLTVEVNEQGSASVVWEKRKIAAEGTETKE